MEAFFRAIWEAVTRPVVWVIGLFVALYSFIAKCVAWMMDAVEQVMDSILEIPFDLVSDGAGGVSAVFSESVFGLVNYCIPVEECFTMLVIGFNLVLVLSAVGLGIRAIKMIW